jgi:hypothetical protein
MVFSDELVRMVAEGEAYDRGTGFGELRGPSSLGTDIFGPFLRVQAMYAKRSTCPKGRSQAIHGSLMILPPHRTTHPRNLHLSATALQLVIRLCLCSFISAVAARIGLPCVCQLIRRSSTNVVLSHVEAGVIQDSDPCWAES